VDNWKNITNSQNRVRKKSFGGTFCFSNCHIIRLDTGGSALGYPKSVTKKFCAHFWVHKSLSMMCTLTLTKGSFGKNKNNTRTTKQNVNKPAGIGS
jgi:hypothetical protein